MKGRQHVHSVPWQQYDAVHQWSAPSTNCIQMRARTLRVTARSVPNTLPTPQGRIHRLASTGQNVQACTVSKAIDGSHLADGGGRQTLTLPYRSNTLRSSPTLVRSEIPRISRETFPPSPPPPPPPRPPVENTPPRTAVRPSARTPEPTRQESCALVLVEGQADSQGERRSVRR